MTSDYGNKGKHVAYVTCRDEVLEEEEEEEEEEIAFQCQYD